MTDAADEPRVDSGKLNPVLAEYIRRRERGEAVDVESLCRAHPELAGALRSYAAGEGLVAAFAGGPDPSVVDSAAAKNAETLHPGVAHKTDRPTQGRFGRYEIIRTLGEGAMGSIYLARDTNLDRDVALKIPKFKGTEGPEFRQRFSREARAAAKLDHPCICRVYDADEINGTPFISMAYLDGQPLSRFVGTAEFQDQRRVAEVIREIAVGLAHAHAQGVLHRDLKPGNVMMLANSAACITDFGLARHVNSSEESRITHEGTILGTPAYMSPEQIEGRADRIGPGTDIYALGVMLYEFLASRLPFTGPVMAILGKALRDRPTPLAKLRPDVNKELEDLCLQMLEKSPEKRPASMQEVADRLELWLKQTSPAAQAAAAKAQKNADSLAQMKQKILDLVGRGQFAAAVTGLEKMVQMKGPQAAEYSAWAREKLNEVKQAPKKLRDGVPALVATARKCLDQSDYAQAAQLLQEIPQDFRTEEAQQLLDEAIELQDESDLLLADLHDCVKRKQFQGIEPNLKRFLQLKPGNKFAKDLHESLQTYSKIPWKQRKYRYDDRGRLLPRQSALGDNWLLWAAACFALIFGAAYWGITIYLKDDTQTVKVEVDPDWLAELGGETTLVVDGDKELTLTGSGEDLAVTLGDHGFTVKRGDTVVHSPQTFTIEKVGRQVLRVTREGMLLAAVDAAASGTSDTVALSPSGDSTAAGVVRHCLEFDGVDDYVEVPRIESELDTNSLLTAEAWVKVDQPKPDRNFILSMSGNPARGLCVDANNLGGGRFYADSVLGDDGSPPAFTMQRRVGHDYTVGNPDTGKWTHVAAVFPPGHARPDLFVNGTRRGVQSSEAASGPYEITPTLDGGFTIATRWRQSFFQGQLRGIKVSRGATYSSDFTPPPQFTADGNTIALYDFSEGQGDVLHDRSGHGYDGKIHGAVWKPASGDVERVEPGTSAPPGLEIDLLAAINAPKMSDAEMRWERDGQRVIGVGIGAAGKSNWKGFRFPTEIGGDYEVELEFQQRAFWPMQIDFPLQDTAVRVSLTGEYSDLMIEDDQAQPNAERTWRSSAAKLKTMVPQKLNVRVRQSGSRAEIVATLDGVTLGTYSGERRRIVLPSWVKPNLKQITSGSLCGNLAEGYIELRRAVYRPLAPASRPQPAASSTFAPPRNPSAVGSGGASDGWTDLFNGRDLTGWSPAVNNDWRVANGVLTSDAGSRGVLWTSQTFADFEMDFEFKLSNAANSGVFIRYPMQTDGLPRGLEVQLFDDPNYTYRADETRYPTGSLHALAQPKTDNYRTGVWNQMRIRNLGRTVTVTLNGREVLNENTSQLTVPDDRKDAVNRNFGYIGLQTYGAGKDGKDKIEFRNMRIRLLNAFGEPLATRVASPANPPATAERALLPKDTGAPLRWLAVSVHDPRSFDQAANLANVIQDRSWQIHGDDLIRKARQRGTPIIIAFHRKEYLAYLNGEAPDFETRVHDLVRANRDVVAGVNFLSPYTADSQECVPHIGPFGARLKAAAPGISYWVAYTESLANWAGPLPDVPPEVDAIEVSAYFAMSPDAVQAKYDQFIPNWKGMAGRRPVLFRWTTKQDNLTQQVLRTGPGTIQRVVKAAEQFGLTGVTLDQFGPREDEWSPPLESDPSALAELTGYSHQHGYGRGPVNSRQQAANSSVTAASSVYELRVETCEPGKLSVLSDRFRDVTCRLMEQHGMRIVGFWTPVDGAPAANTLVYLLAHQSRAAADQSWAALQADSEWQRASAASLQQHGKLVAKSTDRTFLTPTGYSPRISTIDPRKVYELRTYQTNAGKLDLLNARFRDHTLRLLEKHGLQNVGYWVPQDAPASGNTLVYLVAHESSEALAASWTAFTNDPEWTAIQSSTEAAGSFLSTEPQSMVLKPTDYAVRASSSRRSAVPFPADGRFTAARSLTEVNQDGPINAHPRIAPDGLSLYWTREAAGVGSTVMQATRQTTDAPFSAIKPVLQNARLASVSPDGLEIACAFDANGDGKPNEFCTSRRATTSEEFPKPQVIPSMTGLHHALGSTFADHGNTIIVLAAPQPNTTRVYFRASRSGSGDPWGTPQRVTIPNTPPEMDRLTIPSLTSGGKHLIFAYQDPTNRPVEWGCVADATSDPLVFANPRHLLLDGERFVVRGGTYCPATGELFYTHTGTTPPFDQSEIRVARAENALMSPLSEADDDWTELFNGRDLTGWEGRADQWTVEDGAITGRNRVGDPNKTEGFLVWTGGEVTDFELSLQYKITAGNSGIQYRSQVVSNEASTGPIVQGYQADLELGEEFNGANWEEGGRKLLALPGERVRLTADSADPSKVVKTVAGRTPLTQAQLQAAIRQSDWNTYRIVARGNTLQHFINGHLASEVIDDYRAKAARSGQIALQLLSRLPTVVQFKDIRLLDLTATAAPATTLTPSPGSSLASNSPSSASQPEIEKALSDLKAADEAAGRKFLRAFSQEIESIRSSASLTAGERVVRIQSLEAEKSLFEQHGHIPFAPAMRAEAAKYLRALADARQDAAKEYDRLINSAIRQKHDAIAEQLKSERDAVLGPRVIARWRTTEVRGGKVADWSIWSNGSVGNSKRENLWTMDERRFAIQWFLPPSTRWVDTFVFGADCMQAEIVNDKGELILRGRRVAP